MKILVVGGGGREHAIIKKLKLNPVIEEIFALPGNGGMAADATTQFVNDGDIRDWNSVVISGIQWGVLNTAGAFLGSLAGPVSILESALLSGIFGSVTSAVGMTMDVLRNRTGQARQATFNQYPYVYAC